MVICRLLLIFNLKNYSFSPSGRNGVYNRTFGTGVCSAKSTGLLSAYNYNKIRFSLTHSFIYYNFSYFPLYSLAFHKRFFSSFLLYKSGCFNYTSCPVLNKISYKNNIKSIYLHLDNYFTDSGLDENLKPIGDFWKFYNIIINNFIPNIYYSILIKVHFVDQENNLL